MQAQQRRPSAAKPSDYKRHARKSGMLLTETNEQESLGALTSSSGHTICKADVYINAATPRPLIVNAKY